MIAYFKCLCGANRQKAKQLQTEGYEIRIVNKNPEWRRKAREIGAKLPFKVTEKRVEEI